MKVFSELEAHTSRNILRLMAAGFAFWLSLASLLPTLPLYVDHIGGSSQEVGLVMGAFAVGLLLFRAKLGQLADNKGRKIILLIGTFVVALSPIGYYSINTIGWLIVVRAFHGISIAAFGLGYSALIVDLSPPDKRGELLGYASLVQPTGVALGTALGGLVHESFGFEVVFLLSYGLGVLSFIGMWPVQEKRSPQDITKPSSNKSFFASFFAYMISGRLRTPTIVMFLIGLVFGAISTFAPLHIKGANIGLNPGLFYTAAAIASFSTRLFAGSASDKYGRGIFITISIFCYIISMILLSTAYSIAGFLVAGFMEGIGGGIMIPMMIALSADRSEPHERGLVLSVCITGFDVALAIAGPCLGLLVDSIGYSGIFMICAIFAFMALIIFLTLSSKTVINSMLFALGRFPDTYALNHKT